MKSEDGVTITPQTRIMIVEDEAIVAMEIENRLRDLGYGVCAMAVSGEAALQKASETHPDLILMDIRLKGAMDGVEAASQIRTYLDIPIIYLTAHSDEHTLQRVKVSEPFGYILKPFEERELHTTIEMALYRYRLEKRLRENERWLNTTLNSIGDGMIATDSRGSITFMNPVAEALTGWGQADALGRELAEVFHIVNEETRDLTESSVMKVLREGFAVGLAHPTLLIGKDGRKTPIEENAAPIKDEQGNISGVVLVFRDVTERKQAKESLWASEQKFHQVIERSGDAVVLINEIGLVVEWNPAAEQLTGLTRAEVVGKQGWDVQFALLPSEHRSLVIYEQIKATSQHFFQTGQDRWLNRVSEFVLQRPDGSFRDIQSVDFSIKTEQGFWRGSIIRDVTERKLAERIEAAQLAVSRILARSPQEKVALAQVLESIASRLEWPLAELWWRDEAGSRLVWQGGWHTPDLPGLAEFEQASQGFTFEPGEGLAGVVWQTGCAIWDKEMATSLKRPRALLAGSVGLRSATGIPIIVDGDTVAVMTFFCQSARPLEERLLTVLTDLGRQIGQFLARKQAEAEREQLILELQAALTQVKQLEGILPICSFCKKIRGEDNQWYQMEAYISLHSEAQFSHTFCPNCGREHYPEFFAGLKGK